MSDVGDPGIPALGIDLDIRTDLPRYRVWRDGEVVEEPTDIMAHWRDDLVAFVIGCSYSFEEALLAEGLPLRHIERNRFLVLRQQQCVLSLMTCHTHSRARPYRSHRRALFYMRRGIRPPCAND